MSTSTRSGREMTNDELRDWLNNIDAHYKNNPKAYNRSGHFDRLKNIFGAEEWNIDTLVMMRIGNPPNLFHLNIILKLCAEVSRRTTFRLTFFSRNSLLLSTSRTSHSWIARI